MIESLDLMKRVRHPISVLVTTLACAILLSSGLNGAAHAQSRSFEASSGSAANIPTPLTVRQTGYPIIRLTAHYDTKPLGPNAPYYSWRLDVWNKTRDRAWELRQVHHRLFLTNNPPEIQFFAIHYGYNFFMLGRAWKKGRLVYHLDAGVIVTAPQNTVRGRALTTRRTGLFDAGYKLGGMGAEFALSREFAVTKRFYIVGNVALMAGWARVPVVDGSADVPNASAHAQLGVGFRF